MPEEQQQLSWMQSWCNVEKMGNGAKNGWWN
jgi:hypothetical protein